MKEHVIIGIAANSGSQGQWASKYDGAFTLS